MRALVTGAAGFIGSSLAERLAADGWDVVGVDNFSDYYSEKRKRANLTEAGGGERFEFFEVDLRSTRLEELLDGVDVVFHLAAQPGVRRSWEAFDSYSENNISVTNRLLLAARGSGLRRFVYASSSSVYGAASSYPTAENTTPKPHSPYGVTKLAGEHLCRVYAGSFGIPTVSLRYFTVYGPRQRPDMGMHRLIEAALDDRPFPLYGDGTQVRDFTFVGDVVEANLAAATADVEPGAVFNVSGGSEVSLREVIETVEELTRAPIRLDRKGAQPGDVARTGGDTSLAAAELAWAPQVNLHSGLHAQISWHRANRGGGLWAG